MNSKQGQSARIRQYLFDHWGEEIPAVVLHRIGSGKPNGWCASLSRRISDLRDGCYDVRCRREVVNGQHQTYYTLR